MGAAPTLAPARTPELSYAVAEPRETGGVTTRLILDYVEREAGREAVAALLRSAGLEGRESELRDENRWCSFETKIAMLEAAAEVLDDPRAARRVGAASMDFNVAPGLKVSLRALGSPGLIYRNIGRLCSRFTTTHRMEALEVGSHHARIAYVDTSGTGYRPQDCDLNVGFLSCAPAVFGLPLGRVTHPVCARDGGDTCIYEVRWERGASRLRTELGCALGALATVSASLAIDPALLPEAGALAAAFATRAAVKELRFRRRRWRTLEHHAEQQADAADRLAASLHALVSELRLDDVLEKVTKHARNAVGGKEFVLLVDDGSGPRCMGSSILPRESIATLEAWAARPNRADDEPTVVDDLGDDPLLDSLASDKVLPLRSLCAAPLVYRGEPLGLLVALANGTRAFLHHDIEMLQSYATQAAIAVTNARMFEAQEQLALRDPLTALFNHREFHEALARELDACRRGGGELSVVMFDLDDFKQVNDTAGHTVGDRVLLAAADALRSCSRGSDTAFRVGGDEFALLLPRTDARAGEAVAARVAEAIARIDGQFGVSYGVAEWPADGPAKDGLLAAADERLYEMKRSTRVHASPRASVVAGRDERLACASRLSAKLLPLIDPAEIATATVEELHSSFRYHLAAVYRLDGDSVLRPVAGTGPLVREMTGFHDWAQPADRGVNGRVVRTGEPALVLDTARDPDYVGTDAAEDSGSELSVAIRVRGEVWGVLNLEQLGTGAFDSEDLVFADLVAAHVGAALDRAQLRSELEGTLMTTLAALCDALEHKDAYTAAHADDVADLSEAVGARMGLRGDALRDVRYAALLHDIGKIGIRTEILTKPGKLTEAEFAEMKQHTLIGQRILEPIPFFAHVHGLVRWAHERWDGRGYPDGMSGEAIPLGSRIICACDAFHAMTSNRPYRAAMAVHEAIAELEKHAGTQFDAAVVEALAEEAVARCNRG